MIHNAPSVVVSHMTTPLAIVWFRQDLRITDNPALRAAATHGRILPVYILDDDAAGLWSMGGASRWWLHHSLHALNQLLGGNLWVMRGDASTLLPTLAASHKASLISWNRCIEPWRVQQDKVIKSRLVDAEIPVHVAEGSQLFPAGSITKDDGTPYKVFTPFYRRALASGLPRASEETPDFTCINCTQPASRLDDLGLLPRHNWSAGLARTWTPGTTNAQLQLQKFLDDGLTDYREGRDYPARASVSRLSPYLHFGEISPAQVVAAVEQWGQHGGLETQSAHFVRELLWREFSYALLHFFPTLTQENLKPEFDRFPWATDSHALQCWQQGQTGFPLVDAGMRELWQTGYMHNRVRMIVASFLVKNLLVHWQEGARWFWDTLVDADLANNSCSWQWVAGSGMDAAPYFRIFNPVTQSIKFDTQGEYIKRYVPELAKLPVKYLHDPGSAPDPVLAAAGIKLDETYPRAIVDLRATRQRALDAYQTIR